MKAEERLERAVGRDTVGDLEPLETKGVAAEAIALLREGKAEYAQHQPGCSGEFPPYPCKCGYGEWHGRATKFLEGGDEASSD